MPTSPKLHHYVISDLHLGHKKAIQFEKRTHFETLEDHDQHIIRSINETCTKNDYLWILGDVAFSKEGLERIKQLKCTKALIVGNHDTRSLPTYLNYFTQVRACAEVVDCDEKYLLTHIPVHSEQKERWKYNIHGHLHTKVIKDLFYINVSCELHDFRPQRISSLVNTHKLLNYYLGFA